ncbi:glycerate kinase [Heyndrickxia ginsengihumi]|uniref:Glycerate kinase n=1 Tax=Heyndrickxia ginsengihumi TaxID=363870 RepID=A0A0A6VEC0_9BACI|nr:glycerate kinase [Heyndrickxia ginsengihumi]KHD84889.1 glycerate kinase [Heyndrickxia ginsengihumi]MBE6184404.1 glycerate kinase [Bacillus sp. (in: firmicutes)]MCM3023109.1 glycerate kinase [Heyndrickxia ginsengihumi]
MKIVIAPDSFKGSMSSIEAANSIEKGILQAFPQAETILLPVGDGGEGTLETLVTATGGKTISVYVTGPLGGTIEAEYGILGDGETCVIEMAKASGLVLVPSAQLNPLKATTYGTGELIKKALDDGYKSFILALGGSATNDGGAGMLQALGLKILDENGEEIGFGGEQLRRVASIDLSSFDSRISQCTFLIASDVQNPFIGPDGASSVFGPQKGASPEDVAFLDHCLYNFAEVIEKETGVHLHDLPGAGAAGGIGGAFQAFFPSEMRRGIDVVIEYTKLNELVEGADLVITGEGKVDFQTASGKTPMGVAQTALKKNVPTIIIAGSVGKGVETLYQHGIVSVHSIINRPMELKECMHNAKELTEFAAEQVVRSFFYQTKINSRMG